MRIEGSMPNARSHFTQEEKWDNHSVTKINDELPVWIAVSAISLVAYATMMLIGEVFT